MSNFFASYPPQASGGSGGGVTSLDGMAGALTLVAGTGISIIDGSSTITISSTGSGTPVTIGTFGSTPNSGGLSIDPTTQVLNMQPADGTHPGGVSTTGQTFAGVKNFSNNIFAANLSGTNSGDVSIGTANGLSLSGQAVSLALAGVTTTGALSSTDWNTFNNKQALGPYLTGLTGDGTASGPGNAALTLATVNTNVGSFTNANITVNAKGLITAASNGSSGSVTSVSVASANGFAGTSSGGATPALTLSTSITGILQGNGTAISAASTTGSGSVVLATSPTLVTPALGTPSALVGTNITGTAAGLTAGNVTTNANLTGDVTSVGNATTIANNVVTNAKLATMVANTVKANVTGSTANPTDVAITSAATASAAMIRDSSANVQANQVITNLTSIATAAGTTTLTVTSSPIIQFTGTTTQTLVLPDATTLSVGWQYYITNRSTGNVTVNANGGGLLQVLTPQTVVILSLTSIGTSAGAWDDNYTANSGGAVAPTVQKFTSGTSQTYTTPANVTYIRVQMVGGGGGGAGGGTAAGTAAGDGTDTVFGLHTAGKGTKGSWADTGRGIGGTATIGAGGVGLSLTGTDGGGVATGSNASNTSVGGGYGGGSALGGGGGSGNWDGAGQPAKTNSGGGGGGGGGGTASATQAYGGEGGGSGAFLDIIIANPVSTYTYTVGAGGTAGGVGTGVNAGAGGAGAAGLIEVTEYYANGAIGTATNVTGVVAIANGGTNNSSAYTAGSVIYSNGTSLTQDNSNFFWDGTNHRLGIGLASPTTGALVIASNGAASLSGENVSGTWFTGGSGTTTKPQVLIEPTGATSAAWNTNGTGLGINAGSGFTGNMLDLQLNGISALSVASNSVVTLNKAALAAGTTPSDGIILQNTTAAANTVQQMSPSLRLTGQGWKTTATAASQQVDWSIWATPIQGAANPSSKLTFQPQINGGGYASTTGIIFNSTTSTTSPLIVIGGTNSSGTGITSGAANQFGFSINTTDMVGLGANALAINGGKQFGFAAGAPGATPAPDTILTRKAAASLQFGAADAAAPVAQTLNVQNVVTGTSNTAGANLTINGSIGTGTGSGGNIIIQTAPASTTGSTPNALSPAITILGSGNVGVNNGAAAEKLDVTGNIRAQHFRGSTSAPTIAAGTGAGTGPSGVTVTGTDASGTISLTTGTAPATASTTATVTFNIAYGVAPIVVLTPANAATAALGSSQNFVSASSTTNFTITSNAVALGSATAYSWYFHVIQ